MKQLLSSMLLMAASAVVMHAQVSLIYWDQSDNGGERGWRGTTNANVNNYMSWTTVNADLQEGTSTFSTSEQFAVGANVGASPAMFGGMYSSYAGTGAGTAANNLFAKVSVLSSTGGAPNNSFLTRVASNNMLAGTSLTNRAAWLVDQSDFLNLTTGPVGLENLAFTMNKPTDVGNTSYDVRMVILGGDNNFYVSSTGMSGSGGSSNSFTITDLSTETWVNLGASGEDLISTSFGSYGAASLAGTTSIVAAGFIYEQTDITPGSGNQQLYLGGMELAAIPEPSTYAALSGALALGFVFVRRRAKR